MSDSYRKPGRERNKGFLKIQDKKDRKRTQNLLRSKKWNELDS